MKLRPYQDDAIDFAMRKQISYMAIDRGLGKTAIGAVTAAKVGLPALVLAPPKVSLMTWPDEIKKWTPGKTSLVFHGPDKHLRLKLKRDFYILPYTSLKWWYTQAAAGKFPMRKFFMIFDESSWIKNHSADRFKKYLSRMYPIFSDYRMCLSATPSPNGLHQLWPQYYLLDNGDRLGKFYTHYRNKYFIYHGPPRFKTEIQPFAEEKIYEKVNDITFRLENKHFEFMPDVTYHAIELDLPSNLMKDYRKLEKDFYMEFDDGKVASATAEGSTSMKLRQFMQGAVYLDRADPFDKRPKDYKVIHYIKAQHLKEMVEGAAGQSILCAIQFRFEKHMINKVFGKEVPIIAGGTSDTEAVRLMHKWNNRELPLLLCHPGSIGHGLNLQFGGHYLLWYGLNWDLELYIQLIGRLARSGQESKIVSVGHLVFRNTIDMRLVQVLGSKDLTQQNFLEAMKG